MYSGGSSNLHNAINRFIGAPVGLLDLAVRGMLLIGTSYKLAMGERAEDPLVKERKQQCGADAFVR